MHFDYVFYVKVRKLAVLLYKQNAIKSDDLSRVASAAETIRHNFRNCLARGKDQVKRLLLTLLTTVKISII